MRDVWVGRKVLVLHVFLGPDEGEVADVDPTAEGEIDICDSEQYQGDEKSKGKDLEGVEHGICRAEHGGGSDRKKPSDEKDAPEDGGKPVPALEQTSAAVFGERA